jgi:tRNA pseudouridine55 synthase
VSGRGRRGEAPPRSGILVVDKSRGVTSFDVVVAVRRVLGARRVGHGGTLDPEAVGILPVLIGEATKLSPYLVDQDKEYVAVVRWGVSTDTHDLSGRVVATAPVPALSREAVDRACAPFRGRITQTPPMYSALHHAGRRLYELAREGVEVERTPREVVVHALTVEALTPTTATLRIVCGKGMYVRTLAADLGDRLGCGGTLESLQRTRVGPFTLAEAVSVAEVRPGNAPALWARVLGADAALEGWPAVTLGDAETVAFLHGQTVAPAAAGDTAGFVRVYDGAGRFLGVGERRAGAVKPARILHADRPGTRELPA